MALRPNSEVVAIAWLKTLAALPANQVGTVLPGDNSSWQSSGFVQVAAGVGGSPDVHLPIRRPVVQVNCWACNPESNKPPRGKAFALAEAIVAATYPGVTTGVTITVGAYGPAKILQVRALTEPRRLPGDIASYACATLDLEIDWVAP